MGEKCNVQGHWGKRNPTFRGEAIDLGHCKYTKWCLIAKRASRKLVDAGLSAGTFSKYKSTNSEGCLALQFFQRSGRSKGQELYQLVQTKIASSLRSRNENLQLRKDVECRT
jgi:hypothetical protein